MSFHYNLSQRNYQPCSLYRRVNHLVNTFRLSKRRSVANVEFALNPNHVSEYGLILGHTFLVKCMFQGRLIYKSNLSHALFKAEPPHSLLSTISSTTLPRITTTGYRNAVLLVLIWNSFLWALAYFHPAPTVKSFERLSYSSGCLSKCQSIDGFCSDTRTLTSSKIPCFDIFVTFNYQPNIPDFCANFSSNLPIELSLPRCY